jgi:hypothetical protein
MQPASATRIPKGGGQHWGKFTVMVRLTRDRIVRPNLVHVRKGKDDLIPDWDASTNEAGISTLRDDTDAPFIAPLEDLAHLFSGFRFEHCGRVTLVSADPVTVVNVEIL